MTAITKLRMNADEFIAWAMSQPKRYELKGGRVLPMSPERAAHTRAKHLVWLAFIEAAKATPTPCEVFGDGMSVRIDDGTIYEPDTLVRLGNPVPPETVEISDPVIVVEVVSPSSYALDTTTKLIDYFRLPSVQHYLVVDTISASLTHYRRIASDRMDARVVRAGPLTLDPPGITVQVERFLEG
jgi:Uma2 family endonuclease